MTFKNVYSEEIMTLEEVHQAYEQDCKERGYDLDKFQTLEQYIEDNYEVQNAV